MSYRSQYQEPVICVVQATSLFMSYRTPHRTLLMSYRSQYQAVLYVLQVTLIKSLLMSYRTLPRQCYSSLSYRSPWSSHCSCPITTQHYSCPIGHFQDTIPVLYVLQVTLYKSLLVSYRSQYQATVLLSSVL